METFKDLLDRLYEESETRNKENMEVRDYESISFEVGVQNTIKEIKEWIEKNSWWDENDLTVIESLKMTNKELKELKEKLTKVHVPDDAEHHK